MTGPADSFYSAIGRLKDVVSSTRDSSILVLVVAVVVARDVSWSFSASRPSWPSAVTASMSALPYRTTRPLQPVKVGRYSLLGLNKA